MLTLGLTFAFVGALLVSSLYLYLYIEEKERPLLLWFASWAIYSLRFAIQLGMVGNILPPSALILQQGVSLLSGVLFLWGTKSFLEKKPSPAWMYLATGCLLWTILAYAKSFSFFAVHLPTSLFLGSIYAYSGFMFIGAPKLTVNSKYVPGVSLILWGIHKADYAFLRPLEWFAPWGFVAATILFLTSGTGVVLVYTERVRHDLRGEMIRRRTGERLLTSLIDSIPDLIFYKDHESVYMGCNEAFAEFVGRSKEDIIGLTDLDLFPRELAEFFREKDRAMLAAGEAKRNEEWVDYPDGRRVLLDTLKTPYYDQQDNILGLIGISRDITDRKKAEEKLDQSYSLLNAIIEGTSDAIFAKDLQGRYILANTATIEAIGKPRELVIGRSDRDLFPPESAETIETHDRMIMETGETKIMEEQLETAQGPSIWLTNKSPLFDHKGTTRGLIGISRNITDRVQNIKALKESEQLLRDVFWSIQDGISVLDKEMTILRVNPTMERMYPRMAPLEGKKCHEAYHGKKDPCVICPSRRALKSAKLEWDEVPYVSPEGIAGTLQLYAFPMKDSDGRVTGIVEYVKDISQHKKDEEEKRKLGAHLRQAQKMEAIGTLAGGIAHDFNNILVPIMGFTEMIMAKENPDTQTWKDLSEVLNAARRARDLVRQILTFSRQSEHERSPLLVSPIVKECVKLLRASIPKNIEIRESLAAQYSVILADPTHIHQIVMNLGTNAFQAMQDSGGGTLSITLEETEIKTALPENPALFPGPYVVLTVGDTGKGIDKSVINRIFEPYFTTKKQGEGTGMGLSVVHGIVKSYEGHISVKSAPGVGSVFTLYFPAYRKKSVPSGRDVLDDDLPRGCQERILLVDDEETIIQMMHRMLEGLGYQVTSRTSSIEALNAFKAGPDKFDLVITDQAMPAMTGDQLSMRLRDIRPELPIILCTGYSNIMNEEKAKMLGIKTFLMKPVIKSDLARAIRTVLS